jgi:hypothetical protein
MGNLASAVDELLAVDPRELPAVALGEERPPRHHPSTRRHLRGRLEARQRPHLDRPQQTRPLRPRQVPSRSRAFRKFETSAEAAQQPSRCRRTIRQPASPRRRARTPAQCAAMEPAFHCLHKRDHLRRWSPRCKRGRGLSDSKLITFVSAERGADIHEAGNDNRSDNSALGSAAALTAKDRDRRAVDRRAAAVGCALTRDRALRVARLGLSVDCALAAVVALPRDRRLADRATRSRRLEVHVAAWLAASI